MIFGLHEHDGQRSKRSEIRRRITKAQAISKGPRDRNSAATLAGYPTVAQPEAGSGPGFCSTSIY
jgi:hypothetical protein